MVTAVVMMVAFVVGAVLVTTMVAVVVVATVEGMAGAVTRAGDAAAA